MGPGPHLREAVLIIAVRTAGIGVKKLGSAIYFCVTLPCCNTSGPQFPPLQKMRGLKTSPGILQFYFSVNSWRMAHPLSGPGSLWLGTSSHAQFKGLVVIAEANNWVLLKGFLKQWVKCNIALSL